ncbi:hypothetical protein PSACC_00804 [Paramicrosporidium saccamoebae]|uniref:Mannosyltransferase n=1 Tax=Paramicrosporidium saccamoebae TaxID=1246581 RepID=A0A2H9TNG5_9FUNG|nr:hypothetical protein PSACC_00804 [Paramicrosporidium saccamoebae]
MAAMGAMGRGKDRISIALLAICSVAFRFEMALLSLLIGLFTAKSLMGFVRYSLVLAIIGSACVLVVVPIDSYFWQKLSWPELSVFYFNAILNKSSEWGVSPWNWYWKVGLPGTMLLAYPFAVAICAVDRPMRYLCLPFLAFTGAMSLLPHKELRFIFHVIPVLNTAAARLLSRATGSPLRLVRWIGRAAIVCILTSTIFVTTSKVYISRGNYPGAVAILDAQRIIDTPVVIHIDESTAMSGISRFLQYRQDWVYTKLQISITVIGLTRLKDYQRTTTKTTPMCSRISQRLEVLVLWGTGWDLIQLDVTWLVGLKKDVSLSHVKFYTDPKSIFTDENRRRIKFHEMLIGFCPKDTYIGEAPWLPFWQSKHGE